MALRPSLFLQSELDPTIGRSRRGGTADAARDPIEPSLLLLNLIRLSLPRIPSRPPYAAKLSTRLSQSAPLFQDALPRRRPHDDLARLPTRLPRHPGSHVLAVPLPRGPLHQHPLQPAQQVLRSWLLVLHGHGLPRPLRHCRLPDLQGAVSSRRKAGWLVEGEEDTVWSGCPGTFDRRLGCHRYHCKQSSICQSESIRPTRAVPNCNRV